LTAPNVSARSSVEQPDVVLNARTSTLMGRRLATESGAGLSECLGVWLTCGEELVAATESELFSDELDVLDPVDPEEAHVVT
jgi:hypothetical protein